MSHDANRSCGSSVFSIRPVERIGHIPLYLRGQRKLPRIRIAPDIVSDPDRLGDVLDQILRSYRGLRRNHGQLVQHQSQLRALLDEKQWHVYMRVEELFNDRLATALDVVARSFYTAGTRSRRRRRS